MLAPDHDFAYEKRHSYDPGSPTLDTMAVFAILDANGIPRTLFDSVITIEDDWRVHSLDLSGRGIDTIPNEIGNLYALGRLNIANNLLRTLPDSIIKLSDFKNFKHCAGPCGNADCCWPDSSNGLLLRDNRLCTVPAYISEWIDYHFQEGIRLLT